MYKIVIFYMSLIYLYILLDFLIKILFIFLRTFAWLMQYIFVIFQIKYKKILKNIES